MKRWLGYLFVFASLVLASPSFAANSSVPNMTAASSVAGTDLWYCAQSAGTLDRKCTSAQFAAYINSLFSQDCTVNSTGTVTCLKTNNVAFTALATTAPGTGVATALGVNVGTAGSFVVNGGALGTPSSGTLTNATGLPIAGISGLGTGVPAALAIAPGTTGSFPTQDGAITTGNCLKWGPGVQDAGAACGSGGSTTITSGTTPTSGFTNGHFVQTNGSTVQDATAVTSVGAGCGTSTGGSAITTTGTVSAAMTKRVNSTTSDTIVAADCGNLVQENNASAIAGTIAQAGTTGFAAGAYFEVCNIGSGAFTLTPTTSTIGGKSTLVIPGASAAIPNCVGIESDGTNYNLIPDFLMPGSVIPNVVGTVTTQSGTTYTFASTDCGTTVRFSNASAVTATIPQGLPVGCTIAVEQAGAGQVAVNGSAVTPATLHSAHSYTKTFGQWAMINIFTESSNVAVLTGDGA